MSYAQGTAACIGASAVSYRAVINANHVVCGYVERAFEDATGEPACMRAARCRDACMHTPPYAMPPHPFGATSRPFGLVIESTTGAEGVGPQVDHVAARA